MGVLFSWPWWVWRPPPQDPLMPCPPPQEKCVSCTRKFRCNKGYKLEVRWA